jgi:hypothetical protein
MYGNELNAFYWQQERIIKKKKKKKEEEEEEEAKRRRQSSHSHWIPNIHCPFLSLSINAGGNLKSYE